MVRIRSASPAKTQSILLVFAGAFLAFYALHLSLSPAVLQRSLSGPFRWGHWLGLLVWAAVFGTAHLQSLRRLTGHDPYLLPAVALLSGWGMLTIWSLLPVFGMRQAVWLAVCGAALVLGFRLPPDLGFLRRFKYVWLTASLLLTALTLVFGVNPLGVGSRMWLGCCGVYFQPSEPLKLMLIAYLAAVMADRQALLSLVNPLNGGQGAGTQLSTTSAAPLLPLLAPTLVMAGLALALLGIQRDLGAAALLLFLYAAIVYVATRRRAILLLAAAGVVGAGVVGYLAYDVVRLRLEAWLNPWLDPSGRSYQIVQALLAVANGGLIGRGAGLGSPALVPLAHSDLIFASVAEQTGLFGVVGLLAVLALVAGRGLVIALRSPDNYRRYLAAGLTAYLAGQGLLIVGGTLRLFPLTGITLPFVSYGGSSLLVSYLALLLLLLVSTSREEWSSYPLEARPFLELGLAVGLVIALLALIAGWWAVYRGPNLLTRTDNPRRAVSDLYVRRGALLDRNEQIISESSGSPGSYVRQALYPALSNVVGYTSPAYGQSGLEAALDGYLRGQQGYPFIETWWNQMVYGQPPPGLDVRLALDLDLQTRADNLLEGHRGALVLLNASTGEILAMASHPGFDANRLGEEWEELVRRDDAPLFNRATLGRYPVGELDQLLPQGFAGLGVDPTPRLRLPTGDAVNDQPEPGFYSPLQAALVAAALSAEGTRPAPRLATAVNLPGSGWTLLPALDRPLEVVASEAAQRFKEKYALKGEMIWQLLSETKTGSGDPLTWYLGGTLSAADGIPLALGLVLEEHNPALAEHIGGALLQP
ncbi:MAG: FtsW/RodA/SpoVE family cell cycle protein [Anaerolineales bacterium]|nr:FtsW/RodA/SpoVE family cell cycle protein [Anaerolineales bacterium]